MNLTILVKAQNIEEEKKLIDLINLSDFIVLGVKFRIKALLLSVLD
jgi:hypothetical protein